MDRFQSFGSRRLRYAALIAASCLSMAFTLPGCPDVEGMNAKLEELEKKTAESEKMAKDLTEQVRVLNDEHNTMKQLVSQISTTVLEQKEAVERLDASVQSRRSAPATAAKKAAPARRRR